MKHLVKIIIVIFFVNVCHSQDSQLTGIWHLQHIEINGITESVPEIQDNDDQSFYPSFDFTESFQDSFGYIISGNGTYSTLYGYYTLNNNTLTFNELNQSLGPCYSPSNDVCDYESLYFSVIYDFPHNYMINEIGSSSVLTITNQSGNIAVYVRESLSNSDFDRKIDLSIYPNPVKNQLILEDIDIIEDFSYSIISITGQTIVLEKELKNHTIEVVGLESGIYFLELKKKNLIETFKFVKE